MTEYKLQCRVFSTDFLSAGATNPSNPGVVITAYDIEGERASVYADPGPARAFARGILALCDEIDGGEVTAPGVKVGDRVEITQDLGGYPEDRYQGRTGTLTEHDDPGDGTKLVYRVAVDNAPELRVGWWCRAVRKVDDEPTPDATTSATRRPQPGDVLRILEDDANFAAVIAGELVTVTDRSADVGNGDFFVVDKSGDLWFFDYDKEGEHWAFADGGTDEPVTPAIPADESREALLRRAARLSDELGATDADIIEWAYFLAQN